MELEDLIKPSFYNRAVNAVYNSLFKKKLGKKKVMLGELNRTKKQQIKWYLAFFREKRLGEFNKISVAKQIYSLTAEKSCDESVIGENTIKSFERLFSKINSLLFQPASPARL